MTKSRPVRFPKDSYAFMQNGCVRQMVGAFQAVDVVTGHFASLNSSNAKLSGEAARLHHAFNKEREEEMNTVLQNMLGRFGTGLAGNFNRQSPISKTLPVKPKRTTRTPDGRYMIYWEY